MNILDDSLRLIDALSGSSSREVVAACTDRRGPTTAMPRKRPALITVAASASLLLQSPRRLWCRTRSWAST